MLTVYVFGFVFGLVSLALWFVAWFVGFRKGDYSKKCTVKTTGVVSGVSPINYAGHHIPLVSYVVGNHEYTVAGPKFKSGTSAPTGTCNLTTRDELPEHLVAPVIAYEYVDGNIHQNEEWYSRSPISTLYPLGSEATVFYNPSNPNEAYVERYIREGWVGRMVLLPMAGFFTLCTAFVFWVGASGLVQG